VRFLSLQKAVDVEFGLGADEHFAVGNCRYCEFYSRTRLITRSCLVAVVQGIPREVILQREQEPDIDYDELSNEEAVAIIEQARRRLFLKRVIETVQGS